jgi:NAD(P)-dependent dehydrogenase (short-subunit alcohol dehydrogenase family)
MRTPDQQVSSRHKEEFMTSRFHGKVAVVTGGGGGIGKATALALAAEGASIGIVDFKADLADAAAREVQKQGGKAAAFAIDVADEAAVEKTCAAVTEQYGSLDVMVCAAGLLLDRGVPGVDYALSDWDRLLNVNLLGTLLCARSAARRMLAQRGGSIVTVASINALRAVPGAVAYNAAKAGVVSITQTLAIELAKSNIRVNCVAPAQIETPMTAKYKTMPEQKKIRAAGIPMGRFGKPEEVANAIAFLASDEASFINGHTLLVDGGRNIMQHAMEGTSYFAG